MLERQSAGELPAKHHIQLRGPDGALRVEECLTREGFAGAYTLMYHLHRPHPSDRVAAAHGWPAPVEAGAERHLSRRHLWSGQLGSGGAPVDARRPLLFNDDVVIGVAKPDAPDPVYVVHAEAISSSTCTRAAGCCAPSSATCGSGRWTTCLSPRA
jgi:homogentisate 1,2-dioxygenase